MPRHVIRTLRVPHCKRGPARCEACRAGDVARICLLDVNPPDAGRTQRPVIEVTLDGETVWRPYDVVRTFADEAEARSYATRTDVEDLAP